MGRKNKASRKAKAPVVEYWHGGASGREVGDQLVPGTQVPGYSHVVASMTPEEFAEQRPDFVHITSDRNLAFDYAISFAKFGPAALYRLRPLGHLEHDPDYPRGVSHRCRSALVLAVEPDVITAETVETGAARGYETWDDGSPLYDDEGYPLPNRLQQHFGITPAHLRSLGHGADIDAINNRVIQTARDLRPGLSPEDVREYQQAFK
jgi:hypothetical protein